MAKQIVKNKFLIGAAVFLAFTGSYPSAALAFHGGGWHGGGGHGGGWHGGGSYGHYYYHGGHWHGGGASGWLWGGLAAALVVGTIVATLPPYHETVYVGGAPYYYYDNVYYRSVPNGYVVVQAPPVTNVITVPQAPPITNVLNAPPAPVDVETAPAPKKAKAKQPKAKPSESKSEAKPAEAKSSESKAGDALVINIPNANGGFSPVKLTKDKTGYTGPQGEHYEGNPTVEQLKVLYSK